MLPTLDPVVDTSKVLSKPVPIPEPDAPAEPSLNGFGRFCRLAIWCAIYAMPVIASVRPVTDWDIWWHLRVGQWIVEHRTVPMHDVFSQLGPDHPWIAYSWLFEVLVYGLYQVFGLYGIILYRLVLSLAMVAALHHLIGKREPRFLVSACLVGASVAALAPLWNERSWLFSILFNIWTLDVLLDLRAGKRSKLLFILPVTYLLWANLHIQFIYGLFILCLGCAVPIIDRWLGWNRNAQHAAQLGTRAWWQLVILTVACAAATLVTPYHLHLYRVIGEYAQQSGLYGLIAELGALEFRAAWDWAVLGLALASTFALGRRRQLSAFDVLLLIAATWFSFRTKRDLWFVTLAAVAILSTGVKLTIARADCFPLTRRRLLIITAVVVIISIITAGVRRLAPQHLDEEMAALFPARAADFVAQKGYTGPLYNHFNWGGYLLWRLPHLPVLIDGRADLHGARRIEHFQKVWTGQPDWDQDPDLMAAHVIIAEATSALATLLRRDEHFQLVYEDSLAVVLLRCRPAGDGHGAN